MTFKLIVFIGIVIAVAVLGTRAYRSSVREFEARLLVKAERCDDDPQ